MADEVREVLTWSGPHRLPDVLLDGSEESLPTSGGVYLWCVERGGQYHVNYIGSARRLRQRNYDRLVKMMGGGEWIPVHGERGPTGWSPPGLKEEDLGIVDGRT